MSTVAEIEEAIQRLSAVEREALESRVLSRRFGFDPMDAAEHTEMMQSLDEAEQEIETGNGLSAEQVRQAVRSWHGR